MCPACCGSVNHAEVRDVQRSLTIPRMNSSRLVVAAAALTIAVTGMLASMLAVLGGQSLPQAVHNQLVDSNTTLTLSGPVDGAQDAEYSATLPGQLKSALGGGPAGLLSGLWSDPFSFTGRPAPPSSGNTQEIVAATFDDFAAHAVLVRGTWPAAPVRGEPIPAALPATAGALLHLVPGDTVRFRNAVTNAAVEFTITGLYRPADQTSRYWQLDTIGLAGVSTSEGFSTYGPLTVQPSALAANGPLAVGSGSWLAQPDAALIPAGQFSAVAARVNALRAALENPPSLPGLTVVTSLPTVLEDTAASLNVARSLLAICAILLILMAGAALLAVTRLLTGQREGETAMLIARGATRGQLARLAIAEAVPLCVLSAAAGAAAGAWLASVLISIPVTASSAPSGQALAGQALAGRALGSAVLAGCAVALGALVIMLGPALSRVTPGAARARRGRQAAIAGISRAGTDLALIVLAVLTCWQLRHYSAVSSGANGTFGVDPVVVLAPALALAAGTVTALRLLPAVGRAGDRMAARGRRLTGALASWQISRQPLRQGGAALLIVLATASATLAYAQRGSWERSDRDQAAFQAGANVRVEAGQPLTAAQVAGVVTAPGVRAAMPATEFNYAAGSSEVLAIGASNAAGVALLRADQSPGPAGALFGKISQVPPAGLALPGTGADVQFDAELGPGSLGLVPATITVGVEDAYGDIYQLTGTLPFDGRMHTLTFPLTRAAYPLRITSVAMYYSLPATPRHVPVTFTIGSVSGGPGTTPLSGAALNAFTVATSSSDISSAEIANGDGMAGSYAFPGRPARSASGGAETVTFTPGYGLARNGFAPPIAVNGLVSLIGVPRGYAAVLPGIATKSFMSTSGAIAGGIVPATLDGVQVSVRIVAVVSTFPTVTDGSGALIVNSAALDNVYTVAGTAPPPPDQWWLATAGQQVPPGLSADLPAGSSVVSESALASGLLNNPLSDVPQQAMLGIALAALLLACTGFCVSIAAGVQQRRPENALLAALGVTPRAAATQLSLEKFMLSLPAAVAGLLLGLVLGYLLVPAITLTAAGTAPVPPVLITFGWIESIGTALILAVLPVLVAALVMVRRPDPAAGLRTTEAA
jgi:hypothetical protein